MCNFLKEVYRINSYLENLKRLIIWNGQSTRKLSVGLHANVTVNIFVGKSLPTSDMHASRSTFILFLSLSVHISSICSGMITRIEVALLLSTLQPSGGEASIYFGFGIFGSDCVHLT